MMDTATYRVVYVDRRVNQERDLCRDDSLPTEGDEQFVGDNAEVLSNLRCILSAYSSGMF